MTVDPTTEAIDLVRLVRLADDSADAVLLVKAQLERFHLLGQRDAFREFQQMMKGKAA